LPKSKFQEIEGGYIVPRGGRFSRGRFGVKPDRSEKDNAMRAAFLAPVLLATSVYAAGGPNDPAEQALQRLTQSREYAGYAAQASRCENLQRADPKFTHLAYAQCISAAMTEVFEVARYADLDLVAMFVATYQASSEAVDKKELPAAEADARISQAWEDWTSEQVRRHGPRARVDIDLFRTLTRPQVIKPSPVPFSYTCRDVRGSTVCSSQ
jgi:hypothetical protein